MQRRITPKSTFKPQLESLEGRDLPSAAGIGLFMLSQNIQQGVQAMQAQANAANPTWIKFGQDDAAIISKGASGTTLQPFYTDFIKLGGEIQSVRALNTQIQAELNVFNQAVVGVASDGDQGDQTLAIFAYLQVNGLSLTPGSNSGGSLASQAQSALNQVNQIASSPTTAQGTTLQQTLDQRLNS